MRTNLTLETYETSLEYLLVLVYNAQQSSIYIYIFTRHLYQSTAIKEALTEIYGGLELSLEGLTETDPLRTVFLACAGFIVLTLVDENLPRDETYKTKKKIRPKKSTQFVELLHDRDIKGKKAIINSLLLLLFFFSSAVVLSWLSSFMGSSKFS